MRISRPGTDGRQLQSVGDAIVSSSSSSPLTLVGRNYNYYLCSAGATCSPFCFWFTWRDLVASQPASQQAARVAQVAGGELLAGSHGRANLI